MPQPHRQHLTLRRRTFTAPALLASAFFAVCALATTAVAQDGTVATSSLTGTLHLLQGRGGNVVASIGEDGVLIIDDDYEEMVPAYEAALTDLVGADANPRFIVNTHWHFDHVGGNLFWADRGAVVVAHTNVRERMATRQDMKFFDRVVEPSPAGALPVITFGDSLAMISRSSTTPRDTPMATASSILPARMSSTWGTCFSTAVFPSSTWGPVAPWRAISPPSRRCWRGWMRPR